MSQTERAPKKPIVVWCQHGIEDGPKDFVQRFRWDVSMDHWVPSDTTAEGRTFVPNAGGEPSRDVALFDIANHREHVNVRCKRCRRVVPMRERGAQVALSRIAELGWDDIPLRLLQSAYDGVPSDLR